MGKNEPTNGGNWKNLKYDKPDSEWKHDDPGFSLQQVNQYAEQLADQAITWYYRKKGSKSRFSRVLRYGAILFTALAGLFPIMGAAWPSGPDWLWQMVAKPENPDLMVSLFVGLAATCVAIDRFGGFSTGWIRYIRTAAEIQKALHEFRLDWAKLEVDAGAKPGPNETKEMIARAREFVASVQTLVLQETQTWATEFESNLSQMEKDAKESFEREKQTLNAKLDESKPGHLCLSVTNYLDTDGSQFRVSLEGTQGRIADGELVSTRDTWTRLALPAGAYSVVVTAQINGRPASASKVVEIMPGKVQTEKLTLPRAAAAATYRVLT